MRNLLDIGIEPDRYAEPVARRLRAVNLTAWIVASLTGGFSLFQFIDPSPGSIAPAWFNACMTPAFLALPWLHRFGPLAASLGLIVLSFIALTVLILLIGNDAGMLFYFPVACALVVLLLGADRGWLSGGIAAISCSLLIGLILLAPRSTGALGPDTLMASNVVTAMASCAVLYAVVRYVMRQLARAEARADEEFRRSESLLTNILPAPIAARLKQGGAVVADRYEAASVLFADMEGFTARAADLAPEQLVEFLNRVFSELDGLVARHGLEKIKTTGDAYMVVSGVPRPRADHAQALASLALDIRAAAERWTDPLGRRVPVRIGLASGPVVAGVVGTTKFFYDIWGDTVNMASRMETTGEAGKIQIDASIKAELDRDFTLEPRGEIEVRGKGKLTTWFLVGRRGAAGA